MHKTLIFYPYKLYSASARALAKQLNTKCVRPAGTYKPKRSHIIVNWGSTVVPKWYHPDISILNAPDDVIQATNKLLCFNKLKNHVNIPLYATNKEFAAAWFVADPDNAIVVCRTLLTSHSGRGIVVATKPEELVDAPLYTKHVRHKHEYRVHVVNGKVIDFVQKKKSKEGVEDNYIRSHDNGFVFCRQNVLLPDGLDKLAITAVKVLGLDFGAVDIAYRVKDRVGYVLEVNTAPGIEGQTVDQYTRAFLEIQNAV